MGIKWRLTALFIVMTVLALLLFWVGESALMGSAATPIDPLVVILALLLPSAIVYFYGHKLARRLEQLHFTTQRIARGDFEPASVYESTDEVGQFAGELNRLARHIEVIIQKGTQEAYKMETILAGMQEGVIALDHVGRIVLVNTAAEKIFGRKQEEVKLKGLLELVSHQELEGLVNDVLDGKAPGIIELNLDMRLVRFQVSPILTEHGRQRGAVIVCYDVTELRRLEQMRTEFVANVSHELRTPLTSIKGFVETLQDGAVEVPALRERFLRIIESETLRLQRLVDDLLSLSYIENRKGDAGTQVSRVQQAYAKIQPVIETYAEAKKIDLVVDLDEDLPEVLMSDDLLSQLMLNLLENAVKYTAVGQIWLRGTVDSEYVHLEFGDTGCGIPAESLPRIFERFYRVDRARSREQGGTGLGLSIVKHIIEGSGSKISVCSKVGTGTLFVCHLRRADHGAENGGEAEEPDEKI